MLVLKQFNSGSALLNIYRGTEVSRGTGGVSLTDDATFTDSADDAFASVEVGDVLSLSGSTVSSFVVATVTDVNTLEVTPNIPDAGTARHWRIHRGGVAPENVVAGPFVKDMASDGFLIYDEPLFLS